MKTISWIKIAICVSILVGTLLLTSCSILGELGITYKDKAAKYKGIGSSVNLLTGSYTEFASGTTSVFDKEMFNWFEVKVVPRKEQKTVVEYSESLQEYIDQISETNKSKMKIDASIGYAGIAKVSAGYSFEVSDEYVAKDINETKTIFYDMDYYYIDKIIEIDGYNNKSKLSSALSKEFKANAEKVQRGTMKPQEFVDLYGTHVVVAGVYGATFDLHYEMIADTETVEKTFTHNTKESISAQIGATIYGIQLGVGAEDTTETQYEAFTSTSNSEKQTDFTVNARGGNATGMAATSLGEFAPICEKWASTLKRSRDYVLVDVPDNSLIFVWDLLTDSYSGAKDILNDYFETACKEKYDKINAEISNLYADFCSFDKETGTLSVNLSPYQSVESASIVDKPYQLFGKSIIDSETGNFIIHPGYDFVDVKKVVFKGLYGTINSNKEYVETTFDELGIKFDDDWVNDIVIELEGIGLDGVQGLPALDFSDVKSKNITLILTGNNKIVGGKGITEIDCTKGQYREQMNGLPGIKADKCNLFITGSGGAEIVGGNGIDTSLVNLTEPHTDGGLITRDYIENGCKGGIGITCPNVTINVSGILKVIGGNAGLGAGGNCADHEGYDGDNGADGASGGVGISATSIQIDSGDVTFVGGNGGKGGSGGCCNPNPWWIFGDTEYGGNGGKGGAGGYGTSAQSINITGGKLTIIGGNGAQGGDKGGVYKGQSGGREGSYGSGGSAGQAIYAICVISGDDSLVTLMPGEQGTPGTGSNCRDH